ncbi:hypothetical protein Tco_1259154, partial [Tanacetum coccineum]
QRCGGYGVVGVDAKMGQSWWWKRDGVMMMGLTWEGDGGMGMAAVVVAASDGEWRVAASGVVDRSGSTKL